MHERCEDCGFTYTQPMTGDMWRYCCTCTYNRKHGTTIPPVGTTAPNAANARCPYCGDEMTDNEPECPSCWQRSIDPRAPGADPGDFTYEDQGHATIIRPNNNPTMSYVFPNGPDRETAEERSSAPNAANAAPIMPVCEWCKGTGWDAKYTPRNGIQFPEETPCYNCNGTGRQRGSREGFPPIIRPGHLGADESLPAYAWPGGYPLAYLPGTVFKGIGSEDDLIDTNSVILCADCATQSLKNPDEWSDEEAMTSVLEDGDLEQDTVCDGCHAIIAHQNYCYECRECVDTEDAPHLCPKTEPYTVRGLRHCPGTDWEVMLSDAPGPDAARRIARDYAPHFAFMHVQPTRLVFPPVITEEEE